MRSKSSKAEEKTEVVKDNDKLQIKTINKCAKLNPNRSFAKKAKQVKLNIKKMDVNVKKVVANQKAGMKKIVNKLKL